jgi:hypothetical protein
MNPVESQAFLDFWLRRDWETISKEWGDALEKCYVQPNPLPKPAASALQDRETDIQKAIRTAPSLSVALFNAHGGPDIRRLLDKPFAEVLSILVRNDITFKYEGDPND